MELDHADRCRVGGELCDGLPLVKVPQLARETSETTDTKSTKSLANIDNSKNLPPDKTGKVFIWTQTKFASRLNVEQAKLNNNII